MKRSILSLGLFALTLTACTSGQTSTPNVTSVDPIANSKLQLAVGTANINGVHGLNVVATLRQTAGQVGNSVLFNTPTLTGPFTFAAGTVAGTANASGATWPGNGPSAAEITANTIGSTLPSLTVPPNQTGAAVPASARTTFGLYGGISATGFHQVNSNSGSTISLTSANTAGPSIVPFPEPIYGSTPAALAASFVPWVGAPAFPGPSGLGTRDGTFAQGTTGVDAGVSVFDSVNPGAGTYTLNTVIPNGFTSGGTPTNGTVTTSAPLAAPGTFIGGGAAIAAPGIVIAAGGATVTATLPSGATGALLFITDQGPQAIAPAKTPTPNANCYPGAIAANSQVFYVPAVYTIQITASGTYTLPATLGPRPVGQINTATPSICSGAANSAALGAASPGDTVVVQMMAYNYNLPSLIAANSLGNPAPTMPVGDANIAISAQATVIAP